MVVSSTAISTPRQTTPSASQRRDARGGADAPRAEAVKPFRDRRRRCTFGRRLPGHRGRRRRPARPGGEVLAPVRLVVRGSVSRTIAISCAYSASVKPPRIFWNRQYSR